jgi:hypothetical protein
VPVLPALMEVVSDHLLVLGITLQQGKLEAAE